MTKNRWLAGICAALMFISQSQTDYVLGVKVSVAASNFCTDFSGEAACDYFASDDLSTNWDINGGTGWAIASGVLTGATAGTAGRFNDITWKTAAGSNRYAIVKLVNLNSPAGVELNAGSTKGDVVYYDNGSHQIFWGNMVTGGIENDIGECNYTATAGDYLSAKVTGVDSTRVMEIWMSATVPTAAPSGTPLCKFIGNNPTCEDSGAADGTCSCIMSNCYDAATTTGTKVGVVQYENTAVTFDNFAGGPP